MFFLNELAREEIAAGLELIDGVFDAASFLIHLCRWMLQQEGCLRLFSGLVNSLCLVLWNNFFDYRNENGKAF